MNFNESTNNTEFGQALHTTSFSNVNYEQTSERFINNTRRQSNEFSPNSQDRNTEFMNIRPPNYTDINNTPPDSNSMLQQYDNLLSLNSRTNLEINSTMVGNNFYTLFNPPPPHYFSTSINPENNSITSNNTMLWSNNHQRDLWNLNNNRNKKIGVVLLFINIFFSILSHNFFLFTIYFEMIQSIYIYYFTLTMVVLCFITFILTFTNELWLKIKYKRIIRFLNIISLMCTITPIIIRIILKEIAENIK